jgi:UDP-glucose 4-epimerase
VVSIKRILVTGGCGFIGANLVRFTRARTDWDIRVVDDLRSGREEYLEEESVEVMIGDIADRAILDRALQGVDAVIHLAAQTGVIPSVENPTRDFKGNAEATFHTLDCCRGRGIGRFLFASSGAALGDVEPPLHEEVVARPMSPYGAAKLAGEAYCSAFAAAYGIHTVSLRFSNVYGPWSSHKNNAIPNFIKATFLGQRLKIFGDGSQSRDFIYVDDLCEAIFLAVTADDVKGEVFQVATGVETTVLELTEAVQRAVGTSTEVEFLERRPGEVYKSRVDISKVRARLGFRPRVGLDEGLHLTADWYRDNWFPQQYT